MVRPWSNQEIRDSGEPLIALPDQLYRLEPHPYKQLGAPYGLDGDPFKLRQGVVNRLLTAQGCLQQICPQIRLAVFDGWRPLAVQAFMVDYAINQQCVIRGIDRDDQRSNQVLGEIIDEVGRFWAPPSSDPLTPPPHSTGAAVDLTLADLEGTPLTMGGEIDDIGPMSEPNAYSDASRSNSGSPEAVWHQRRSWLACSMRSAGFAQHPNEWWHFSFGDQLWCWLSGGQFAIYGALSDSSSIDLIN